jgi:hypothetical protein
LTADGPALDVSRKTTALYRMESTGRKMVSCVKTLTQPAQFLPNNSVTITAADFLSPCRTVADIRQENRV